ncbi:MAG: hypothetical protein GPJ54_18985 [Candidatus Heimdallarchaeota archaeon]|nr:hypothetical protein [Candidatus Heimdallarchaeota archaeon]
MFTIERLIKLIRYTILDMSKNLRVHIAPVGFQFRRVTEPLIKMRADTVYLVSYKNDDKAKEYYSSILNELSKKYNHIKIVEVFIDIWDLYECIEKFRDIIKNEAGNTTYINVSTGTKITAIAGMLSCMMWNAIPYYAPVSYIKSEDDSVSHSELVGEPIILPNYEINKPRAEYMLILHLIKQNGGKQKKFQLIQKLEEIDIIRLKDESKESLSKAAKHSQLRALLDPMENDWKYIKIKSAGRLSIVSITEQGETALKIFGFEE